MANLPLICDLRFFDGRNSLDIELALELDSELDLELEAGFRARTLAAFMVFVLFSVRHHSPYPDPSEDNLEAS